MDYNQIIEVFFDEANKMKINPIAKSLRSPMLKKQIIPNKKKYTRKTKIKNDIYSTSEAC